MRVLIVGKSSYIGNHIGRYILTQEPESDIRYVSVRDDHWKEEDFSCFDAVVFAAAIVHCKDITDPELYQRVNAILPWEFANKVREQGVERFLFLSTAAVYGAEKTLPKGCVISRETPLSPGNLYGKSKLQAEQLLSTLGNENFKVSIVRPMNVYGENCPGNYIASFRQLTRKLPVLPKAFTDVKQGMVHVENLARLCYLALKADTGGVYHAQDDGPVSSYEIMAAMSQGMGKPKKGVPCHTLARCFGRLGPVVKLFGGVAYDRDLAVCPLGTYGEKTTVELLCELMEKLEKDT